jgi:alanine dehydrogenase
VRIGIPTEVKTHEDRVAITPAGVRELVHAGHEVFVQAGAGLGSSITDAEYADSGARVPATAEDIWATGELILKVKEPIADEYPRLRAGQVLFTYLHLAADKRLTAELLAAGVTALAYETVQTADGALPLLAPMSEVAGRLAPQVGAATLMKANGGRGVLLGGVPGAPPARVVIIGAGVSGLNAAAIAVGMQAEVTLLDVNVARLRAVDQIYRGRVRTLASTAHAIDQAVLDADLVIGAVLVAGAKAPTLISNELVRRMKPGSVLVDISIDQGGCFQDSHPTTHADPTYPVHSSVFYCVANMPGAVPNTATHALTNVTLPYAAQLANQGWRRACTENPSLASGLNTVGGHLVNAAVAEATGIESIASSEVLTPA